MIRRFAVAVALVLLAVTGLPTHALAGDGWLRMQQRQHPQREQRQYQQPQYDRQYQQPQYDRQYQQPSRRYEEPQGPQGPQRMTPDERRQLRRDLHDANRDIYPQRRY